jgi:hypothetical protein
MLIKCPVSGARNHMPAALKDRIVMSLLLWLMLAPLTRFAFSRRWQVLGDARAGEGTDPAREPRPLSRRESSKPFKTIWPKREFRSGGACDRAT